MTFTPASAAWLERNGYPVLAWYVRAFLRKHRALRLSVGRGEVTP